MSIRELNIKRRRALIEYLVRNDFKDKGFRPVDFLEGTSEERINISDGCGLIISFDLSTAADYKQDAYTWCYVDIFISKHNVEMPDELKRYFSRYVYTRGRRIYWRHRFLVRIVDMDLAVEHILNEKRNLEELLKKHGVNYSR
ncbi:hypothetical protein B6U99_01135 [Candidatus Geothermarchaeota archaeon ex4572_27]|nr:MAG: hypothetical protein B6U99_01135 [Candidatus Geothermarchaeota archaeon ex4572_27]